MSSLLLFYSPVRASYDPRTMPNNIFGIHILFPQEIFQAKDLVNSNSGDWGYVTIPIQSSDKDLDKWQTFMDDARDFHLIPILRLATNGDYFNTKMWEKPKEEDILDFANFLNSLDWPTKNRYVIIYNEVNRAEEWGGNTSPAQYAHLLDFAVDTFKSKNSDFFIISAGLDNAAPNSPPDFMNEYDFLSQMQDSKPGIFSKLDGIASHSYPNPGFSQPPYVNTPKSIYSFKYERDMVDSFAQKTLPVFITETGWSSSAIPQDRIAKYLTQAFGNAWTDKDLVAVTPFLLRADMGPFTQFSFIENGEKNEEYKAIENIQKIKGAPSQTEPAKKNPFRQVTLPIRHFFYDFGNSNIFFKSIPPTKLFFKWLLKI